MFTIKNTELYQTCGDTGALALATLCGIPWLDTYFATFIVKKSVADLSVILTKDFEQGVIVFQEADTRHIPPGLYWYEVEIRVPGENGSIDQVQTMGPYRYHLYNRLKEGG